VDLGYYQGFDFGPRAGGEARIFGFYNNKKTNKNKKGKVNGPGYPAPLRTDIRHPSSRGVGAQPRKEGVQGPANLFLDDFLSIFVKKFLVFKNTIIGNTEFQKTVPYVTARPNNFRLSRRKVKNDVWKYLQIIKLLSLACTVCEHLLDKQDRGLKPRLLACPPE